MGQATTDAVNTVAVGGTSTNPSGDPFGFQNFYRAWGNSGTFPTNPTRGPCVPGTCQIWDFTLVSSDLVARATNACPDGTITDTHTWSDSTTVTFLRSATEILFDGVGNDNGFCESNEDCFYTPNIGSYQGHGNLISGTASTTTPNDQSCADIGTGGTIANVRIFKYQTNGY